MRISSALVLGIVLILITRASYGAEAPAPPACEGAAYSEQLSNLFEPSTPRERLKSVQGLARCPGKAVQGALAAALRTEPDPAIRAAIAEVMGRLQQSDFVRRALLEAQRDPDPLVRAKANQSLAAFAAEAEAEARASQLAREAEAEAEAKAETAAPPAAASASASNNSIDVAPVPPAATKPLPEPAAAVAQPVLAPPRHLLPRAAAASPQQPASGVPLLITTSLLAGSAWGAGLSLMADQSSPGVMLLLGSAGAVIGGGTAFALSRFGVRPTVEQAIWFSNATAWGGLAGLMAYAGSGANDSRLQAGLVVGGESLGLALGAWSASRFRWKPAQTAVADGLVIASALTLMGMGRLDGKTEGIPAWMGYGTAPAMLGAAVLAQHLSLSRADIRFVLLTSAAASLTLGLTSSGLTGTHLLRSDEGQGGLIAGLGFGFLAGTLASPWVEPTSKQLKLASGGWLAGAAFGLGSFMVAFPGEEHAEHRNLGAALGATTFAAAGYWLAPRLRVGPNVAAMSVAGAAVAAGAWTLAVGSLHDDFMTGHQRAGGALALAVGGGIAGAWASRHFRPTAADYATTLATILAGAAGGYGAAMLLSSEDGAANFAGVLIGGAAGLSLGGWANHKQSLREAELFAGAAGGVYGLMVASNLRNFGHEDEQSDRTDDAAKYLGLSLGVLAGTAAARMTQATAGQVVVPAAAMGLGMIIGGGAGELAAGAQGARIGATAVGITVAAASVLLDQRLKLSHGLGGTWFTTSLWGGVLGGFQGLLLADFAKQTRDDGDATDLASSGLLAGAAAGVATGLVLSQLVAPNARDYAFTAGGSLVGLSLGAGLSRAFAANDKASSALRLGGSLTGLLSAATIAHFIQPTTVDLVAGGLAAGYGFALGSLVASFEGNADASTAAQTGGTLGLALGATSAVAVAHALGVSARQVTAATTGTALVAMAGVGLGMAWPEQGSHATRVGASLGLSLGLMGSLLADRWMHLSRTPLTPRLPLAVAGGSLGAYQGILLGRALSYGSDDAELQERQRSGSLVFGAAAGTVTGVLLSNALHPRGVDFVVTGAGSAIGSALGMGSASLLSSRAGSQDAWATLGGSMTGLIAAGAVQRYAPLTAADAGASGVGLALGAVVGGLLPSLHLASVTTSNRVNYGGVMLGASAGSVLGVLTRKATAAQGRTVGMTAWGALHGAVTGMQTGALIDTGEDTQAQRMGAVTGALGGAALGATLWKQVSFSDRADLHTTTAAAAWGAWSGWWVSRLVPNADGGGHAAAGVVAGVGIGSMLSISAAPYVNISDDVLLDALTMNVLVGGAAGGVAMMASRDDQALPTAVLAGGSAGLVLGSLLHQRIHLASKSAPLLTLAIAQGTFTGLLMPSLIYNRDDHSSRHSQGALAVGSLGGATVGLLLTSALKPTAGTVALAGLGSATGAAVGGGLGLVADGLGPQAGAAMALAGSALGLTAGALVARDSTLPKASVFKVSALGAALGAAEGAVFSWAARGTDSDDYRGSMLVGAGLGTTLALASAASDTWQIPASAGFGAWGAWVGSFSGALVERSPHEVTLGGLIGLNLGVAAGYGALTAKWVEPSDFGWLSLFGAAGTLVGGASGALVSSSQNPGPVFIGLAAGPLAGLAVGVATLPMWRRLRGPENKRAATANESGSSLAQLSTAIDAAARPRGPVSQWAHGAKRKLSELIEIDQVMPLVGAMPTDGQSGTPIPFVVGLSGKWR